MGRELKANTPSDVMRIIFAFQDSDRWSIEFTRSRDGRGATLFDGCSMRCSAASRCIAFGTRLVSQGRFMWRIEIKQLETRRGNSSSIIGIVEDSWVKATEFASRELFYKHSELFYKHGYGLCGGNSILMGMDEGGFGEDFNAVGDVLEMTLDLDARTLSFVVNGQDKGVSFKRVKHGS